MIVGEINNDEMFQKVNGVMPSDDNYNMLYTCKTAYHNIGDKEARYLWIGEYQEDLFKHDLYSLTKKTAQDKLEKTALKGMEKERKKASIISAWMLMNWKNTLLHLSLPM